MVVVNEADPSPEGLAGREARSGELAASAGLDRAAVMFMRIDVVDELPRTSVGKIRKFLLTNPKPGTEAS